MAESSLSLTSWFHINITQCTNICSVQYISPPQIIAHQTGGWSPHPRILLVEDWAGERVSRPGGSVRAWGCPVWWSPIAWPTSGQPWPSPSLLHLVQPGGSAPDVGEWWNLKQEICNSYFKSYFVKGKKPSWWELFTFIGFPLIFQLSSHGR